MEARKKRNIDGWDCLRRGSDGDTKTQRPALKRTERRRATATASPAKPRPQPGTASLGTSGHVTADVRRVAFRSSLVRPPLLIGSFSSRGEGGRRSRCAPIGGRRSSGAGRGTRMWRLARTLWRGLAWSAGTAMAEGPSAARRPKGVPRHVWARERRRSAGTGLSGPNTVYVQVVAAGSRDAGASVYVFSEFNR